MSARSTLLLSAVLAVLLGAYWAQGRYAESRHKAAVESRKLFDFAADDINMLSIERAGTATVEAMRGSDGQWAIIEPARHIPANQIVWNRMANALAGLSNERTIEESLADAKPYELEPPHLRVIAGTKTKAVVQVDYGSNDPTLQYRYARQGTGGVILTPVRDFMELNRSLDEMRDTRVVATDDKGVTRLEFARVYKGPDKANGKTDPEGPKIGDLSVKVAFERDAAGVWQLREPIQAKARQDKVEELVREVQFMRGAGYIDTPAALADYSLDPPNLIITAWGESGPRKILLGSVAQEGDAGGLFAKHEDNPSVFVVPGHILTLFPETPDAFRETHLFGGKAEGLDSIRIRSSKGELALTNDPDHGWKLTQPAADDTDQAAVSAFIGFLKEMGGTSFPETVPGDAFATPLATIDFAFRDGAVPSSIVVGASVPNSDPPTHYLRQDDGTVVTVPFEVAMALQRAPFGFRDRRIFAFDPDSAREVDLSMEGTRYLLRNIDARWALIEPADKMLGNKSDAQGLLDILSNIRASGIASPVPAEEVQGFAEPLLSATVTIDTQGVISTLGPIRVGNLKASDARERFAVVAGREEVLFVDQGLIDDLRESLRGIVPKK